MRRVNPRHEKADRPLPGIAVGFPLQHRHSIESNVQRNPSSVSMLSAVLSRGRLGRASLQPLPSGDRRHKIEATRQDPESANA